MPFMEKMLPHPKNASAIHSPHDRTNRIKSIFAWNFSANWLLLILVMKTKFHSVWLWGAFAGVVAAGCEDRGPVYIAPPPVAGSVSGAVYAPPPATGYPVPAPTAPGAAQEPPPGTSVVVAQPPPAPLAEVEPPAPGPDYVWTTGYWNWNGAAWVWAPGVWVVPPYRGAVWFGGRWVFSGGRHVWMGGRWR
jgi:hypothetical protein